MSRYLVADKAFPLKGPGLCRVCGKLVGKGRRTTCSPACQRRLRLACFIDCQRAEVERRDKGVCQKCGYDTKQLDRIVAGVPYQARREALTTMGFAGGYGANLHLWEMDHIQPISEGGGVRPGMQADEILSNLRTLCRPCHNARRKTNAMSEVARCGP